MFLLKSKGSIGFMMCQGDWIVAVMPLRILMSLLLPCQEALMLFSTMGKVIILIL